MRIGSSSYNWELSGAFRRPSVTAHYASAASGAPAEIPIGEALEFQGVVIRPQLVVGRHNP